MARYEQSLVIDEVNEHVDERSQWIVKAVKAALDADKAQGYGFGNGKDGDITKGMTVTPINGSSSRAIIQATSVNLPAGETITTTIPCAGLWIYSHSDIIINGTITMTDKGYYTTNIDSAPDTVMINGESVKLAVYGAGGRSVGGSGGSGSSGTGAHKGGVTQASAKKSYLRSTRSYRESDRRQWIKSLSSRWQIWGNTIHYD